MDCLAHFPLLISGSLRAFPDALHLILNHRHSTARVGAAPTPLTPHHASGYLPSITKRFQKSAGMKDKTKIKSMGPHSSHCTEVWGLTCTQQEPQEGQELLQPHPRVPPPAAPLHHIRLAWLWQEKTRWLF